MIFSKLDEDHSGTLCKKEFLKLIKAAAKGNDEAARIFTKEVFDAVWLDLCKNNENVVDYDRVSEWIFSSDWKAKDKRNKKWKWKNKQQISNIRNLNIRGKKWKRIMYLVVIYYSKIKKAFKNKLLTNIPKKWLFTS